MDRKETIDDALVGYSLMGSKPTVGEAGGVRRIGAA